MIELHHFWDSPCCFKVRLVLAEKGLDWAERYVATHRFEHFRAGYGDLNRHRKVPTLVHDGTPVIQSSDIALYLDEAFPEPRLQPADAEARAVMREWIAEEGEYLFPLVVTLSFNLMMTLRSRGFRHGPAARVVGAPPRPGPRQGLSAAGLRPARPGRGRCRRIPFRVAHGASRGHARARRRPVDMRGRDYSLADICVAPILDRVESLDLETLWEDLPAVAAWYARMKDRPAFRKSAPPVEYRMWGPRKPVPPGGVDPDEAGDTFPAG